MKEYSITDFGASAGKMCTGEIQAAIDALSAEGGGRLVFPAGTYLSATLFLKGNIVYSFAPGSTLKGSPDIRDYVYNGFWHNELGETKCLLSAIGQENITFEGQGTIDFSHEGFEDFDAVIPFGVEESRLSVSQRRECVVPNRERVNQPMFFESCRRVVIKDLLFMHSPCWTITFSRSSDIKITGVTIDNSRVVGNSDGIHLCACKDVLISDCNIKAGDDCIAVTCITAEGEEDISERIAISNCNFSSSSAAVRIGHAKGKVRYVTVTGLTITDSNRGIAIFTGSGGWVKDILVSDIVMETRLLCGAWWGKGEPLVICAAECEGRIENVRVHNVAAHSENGIIIAGQKQNIRNVTISHFDLTIGRSKNLDVLDLDLDFRPNAYLKRPSDGIPAVYARGTQDLQLRDFTYRKDDSLDCSIEPILE